MTDDLTNTCHGCGNDFTRHPREGTVAWLRRKYCTVECSREHRPPAKPQPRDLRRPELVSPNCEGLGDVMFTEAANGPELEAARAVCEGCGDRTACLTFALDNREPYGCGAGSPPANGKTTYAEPNGRVTKPHKHAQRGQFNWQRIPDRVEATAQEKAPRELRTLKRGHTTT